MNKREKKELSKKNLLRTPNAFKNLQKLMNEKEDAMFADNSDEDDLTIYDRKDRDDAVNYDKIDMEMGSKIEFIMTKHDAEMWSKLVLKF